MTLGIGQEAGADIPQAQMEYEMNKCEPWRGGCLCLAALLASRRADACWMLGCETGVMTRAARRVSVLPDTSLVSIWIPAVIGASDRYQLVRRSQWGWR